MPEIDVSDIILDPFISGETFTVIRRAETVNNFGETTTTNTTFTASGSIQATGDNSLLREEAYQAQQKTIQVITTFLLRGATQDPNGSGQLYQPDLVIWKGETFLVRVVDDFSSYGSGMIRAECITQWFSDPAPRPGM
jgi:hypothetical protein